MAIHIGSNPLPRYQVKIEQATRSFQLKTYGEKGACHIAALAYRNELLSLLYEFDSRRGQEGLPDAF